MRRSSAALLLAALLTASTPPPSPSPSAAGLLHSAMIAAAHVSYVGEVQVLRIGMERSDASIYRVEHKAPGETRRWYVAPQGLYGDEVITRGGTEYSIDVKREEVVVSKDEDADQQIATHGNYRALLANYDALSAPDETFDGRRTHVVVLNNKFTGETTLRLHIDAVTHLVLERQEYAGDGSLIAEMRIEQLRYTNSIPKAVFDVPAGLRRVNDPARARESSDVQQVIASAGFAALVPKYLPEGFGPVAGDVVSIKSVPTLHVLYSDGIRTISLFQNEKDAAINLSRFKAKETLVGNHPARYVEEGPTTLLAWSDGARHFALVSELRLSELRKIGASLAP